jgi:PHP domain-containing protein
VPEIRRDFFTLATARKVLAAKPVWTQLLRGDLQMHTQWSDGSGSVVEMAAAAEARGYDYIAITDHSKGLKIAGGIDEAVLTKQAREIARANRATAKAGGRVTVLRSIEMNLNPRGEGDMEPWPFGISIWCLAHFIQRCAQPTTRPSVICGPCEMRISRFSGTRAAAFMIIDWD